MSQYAHPEVLVDPQWLMAHLQDSNLRILEVAMSPETYRNSHIPGAVFWHIGTELMTPDMSLNLDPTVFSSLLSKSGITADTTVVAYGSYPGTSAFMFWLFKLFGHHNIKVLNGGYQQWIATGGPVIPELSTVSATEYPLEAPDASLRVLSAEVLTALDRPDQVLLDVRTQAEFAGDIYLMEPPQGGEVGGHIPGAVHLDHARTLNEDGTFKSADELQALFQQQGITADKEIFPYCAIGGRSAYTWFVLKYLLGYPQVRNYDGSWREWSRLPNVPIQRSQTTPL
ncbi:sulfurtransferase [Acaryochloris sp. IP29b_bin.137]|uniref:sulfurtransferase n=1 Tax=Acaryochloris sp. IP29b_bin.137 TaxID=2969217 RepID=UPI002609AB70|nr:sulfurtransferase [Acaryochloris sp. IP29b_bin.137]